MPDNKIIYSETPQPYQKRKRNLLLFNLIIFFFFSFIMGLNTDTNGFLLCATFLGVILLLDVPRKLRPIRYSIEHIESGDAGIKLFYYDKDSPQTVRIPWDKLQISMRSTFERPPRNIITFKSDDEKVATFYAPNYTVSKEYTELFRNIKELKYNAYGDLPSMQEE